MERFICLILSIFITLDSVCANNRFFISAPNVFHVGIKEKVFVQMGGSLLNAQVTIYLEHEQGGILMSDKIHTTCKSIGEITTVELMIDREKMEHLKYKEIPYLLLVAESQAFTTEPRQRKSSRVLVSQRRGYIFIQTDQPIYNPSKTVRYRIFTLDHKMRPRDKFFLLTVLNADGNRVLKSIKLAKGGIFTSSFKMPDVSGIGTWKILANYEGDDANAATREFKVQKFVIPTFDVDIKTDQNYLIEHNNLTFTISAMYSYGEKVYGAYHCRFGVLNQRPHGRKVEPTYIRGLELTGQLNHGEAKAKLLTPELNKQVQTQLNTSLSELAQNGTRLYMAVSVINKQSGELQETEAILPIVFHDYTIDLTRTRSYFIPNAPLEVLVVVRFPDGSLAPGVPVQIHSRSSTGLELSSNVTTGQEGAAFTIHNFPPANYAEFDVSVTIVGQVQRKTIKRASSPGNNYLYLSVTNRMYEVDEHLGVMFHMFGGSPQDGLIYYMVMSRGAILKQESFSCGTSTSTKHSVLITPHMTPSFRLIGYYYNQKGDVIADSVWVDVKDECEKMVKVISQQREYQPGKTAQITLEVGQKAKVGLLVVDKAIYAFNADNKLSSKQVFSYMQSYDLGCSYGGGADTVSTLNDAGLAFMTQSHTMSVQRTDFGCKTSSSRQRRSLDIQQEMFTIRSNFSTEELQRCCAHGLTFNPMRKSCKERAERVKINADSECVEAFHKCCSEGERLRKKKALEEALEGFARTATDIETFFYDTAAQYIRRYFPPSFEFKEIDVNGKQSYNLRLPDSITTWEVQAVSLSYTHGFCVAAPYEIRAFKKIFVSLRLPYSVRKHEELSIVAVIYNYGENTPAKLAVHMEQTEGICSPGSATATSYVEVTVEPRSSQFVTFSVVPMVTGKLPIKIRVYDIEHEMGIDAIEKTLNVFTEGIMKSAESTLVIKLNGTAERSLTIDGMLPDEIVPDSISNIFVSIEGDGFGESMADHLLSPEAVKGLIKLPTGCPEQTMIKLAPTALALRYLDLNQEWVRLPTGSRDVAVDYIEQGYMKMLKYRNRDGSFRSWASIKPSHWFTAYILKTLSLIADRQSAVRGQQGSIGRFVSNEDISSTASFLLSVQKSDGSFDDPNPDINRSVQGGLRGNEDKMSMTAFITIALYRSLPFLTSDVRSNVDDSIMRSRGYLISHLEELQRAYAVAITAYCLSVTTNQTNDEHAFSAWTRLHTLFTEEDGCLEWGAEYGDNMKALKVETTAYALLTALARRQLRWAEGAACWLTKNENSGGGFTSTHDTVMALEALSEYGLRRPMPEFTRVDARFTVEGKSDITELSMTEKRDKVETDLKKFTGSRINVRLTGKGNVKLKVRKVFHQLEHVDNCKDMGISVKVMGKVEYTARILENYDFFDYSNGEEVQYDSPQSSIEWFDARTRRRRDVDKDGQPGSVVYEVCINLSSNLTGMAIADITLLSGFEALTEDLDRLKEKPEQYILHYEVTSGRVLLYFNKFLREDECISFEVKQFVPVGLLQPAPVSFYDYYEPNRRCTVFYSAPQRSNTISRLCSADVCQCAERPCHVERKRPGLDRRSHACFHPTIDYAYIVEVSNQSRKSNFNHYIAKVEDVLKTTRDMNVNVNAIREFAVRLHCKAKLRVNKRYLIMGKDGSTTDSNGKMQYLLESDTWVEETQCKTSQSRICSMFYKFVSDLKANGCNE